LLVFSLYFYFPFFIAIKKACLAAVPSLIVMHPLGAVFAKVDKKGDRSRLFGGFYVISMPQP